MNTLSPVDQRLLNDYQHGFPLRSRPFLEIGEQVGLSEETVIAHIARLSEQGYISRVGPVFSPGAIGCSTLAALAVPPEQLESVANWISSLREVNHNYQREHRYNLWFVVAGPHQACVNQVLDAIRQRTGLALLVLPLLEQFHIDLGFDLHGNGHGSAGLRTTGARARGTLGRTHLDAWQTSLVSTLQGGIPLIPQPFAKLSDDDRLVEDRILTQLEAWCCEGVLKRFGIVVRHHELGYRDNAMVVWDIPDGQASAVGLSVARQQGVTLCYRRPRHLPDWPYNLFCMIHGKDRDAVHRTIATVSENAGLTTFASQVLFSNRRFKQCGARYVSA